MIYTDISNLGKYKGIDKNLDTAIDYLLNNDLSALVPGRNEVDGDNVYINQFNYTTIPEEEGFFEAHRVYTDIHVVLSGKEQIGIANMKDLTEDSFDEAADFIHCSGPVWSRCTLVPGKVVIAFPEDAHMVKLMKDEPVHVEKAVFKVLVK